MSKYRDVWLDDNIVVQAEEEEHRRKRVSKTDKKRKRQRKPRDQEYGYYQDGTSNGI